MSDSAVDKALFALEHYADWCDGYVPPHRLRETMALLREQARTIARLEGEVAALRRTLECGCGDQPGDPTGWMADVMCPGCQAEEYAALQADTAERLEDE